MKTAAIELIEKHVRINVSGKGSVPLSAVFGDDVERIRAIGSLWLYAERELGIGRSQETMRELDKFQIKHGLLPSYQLLETKDALKTLAFLVRKTSQRPLFTEAVIVAAVDAAADRQKEKARKHG